MGFYPDGVKRTLTDEQIRIFRHSEIHALFRAKQLQQDDADYEARRLSADGGSTAEEESKKRSASEDPEEVEAPGVKSQQAPATKKSKIPTERETTSARSEYLDYEENHQASPSENPLAQSTDTHHSRRIISYDD